MIEDPAGILHPALVIASLPPVVRQRRNAAKTSQ
jgi:hypothetical protein